MLKPKPVNNAREDKLGTAFWRTCSSELEVDRTPERWAARRG